MNFEFSSILTSLRKERHISQKQAASDLQISQALLSHYEKGIRECRLDFVIKCADYYGVSCDYLLGRTKNYVRHNTSDTETTILSDETEINRQIISNSITYLMYEAEKTKSRVLIKEICEYLYAMVYKLIRVTAENDCSDFRLDMVKAENYADISALESLIAIKNTLENSEEKNSFKVNESEYIHFKDAVKALIRNIEQK